MASVSFSVDIPNEDTLRIYWDIWDEVQTVLEKELAERLTRCEYTVTRGYGGDVPVLSKMLDISMDEAREIMRNAR